MTFRIYKYELDVTGPDDEITIELPVDARIFHVGVAPNGKPAVWARANTETVESRIARLTIVGTGAELGENDWVYGVIHDGAFVWHVVERDRPKRGADVGGQ